MIYFIKTEGADFVKIGYANNINRRLTKLQSDCPFKLVVIREIDGDLSKEKNIHDLYHELHYRGEWYHYHPSMLEDNFDDCSNISPLEAVEKLVQSGVYPTKENLKIHLSGFPMSRLSRYSREIKDLKVKYFGCASYTLYLKMKELATCVDSDNLYRKTMEMGISQQSFASILPKLKIFAKHGGLLDKNLNFLKENC